MLKIRVALPLLITGVFSTTALAGLEPAEGEKLITYQPDPEVWEIANKDLLNSKRLVWLNKDMRAKGKTFDDVYQVDVFNKPKKKDLDGVREWSDKKGSLKCRQFESVDIERDTTSTYPSVTWRTTCVKSSSPPARLISKLIEGERHLYQVQKAWVGDVDEADMERWQQRVLESYVCDLNSDAVPCPENQASSAATESQTDGTADNP